MEQTKSIITTGDGQSKYRVIIAAAIFSALVAPFSILFDEGSLRSRVFDFISVIGWGILVLGWCYFDSLERNKPLGSGFRLLIVIFGVLSLFIYLIKSRGLYQGLRSIGTALLICAGIFLIMLVTAATTAAIFGID